MSIERLTEPGNAFDSGLRLTNDHFKAIRDLLIDLLNRLEKLESKLADKEKKKKKDE